MLPCDGPFFRPGPVPYSNTFVHTKFEANLCTWAASRTVDVSRFRVGRRCGRRSGRRIADAAAAAEAVGHRRARSIGLQQHRLVPRSTRFPRAMAVAGSCPSGAQAVREVDLLRAAQSGAMCGGDQLVRTAAADWSARCPAATPVPNHAAWQARRSHVDRRLGAPQRWTISCALTALSSQGAAACPSADFGHLHC